MRYILSASRFRLKTIHFSERNVSYKVKKNINFLLDDIHRKLEMTTPVSYNYGSKSVPFSKLSITVLGNGAVESNAVQVQAGEIRYLFNCGEGLQRLSMEHGFKLSSNVKNVFVTNGSWNNLGGLLGYVLYGTGSKDIFIYGPPEVETMFTGLKSFVIMNSVKINFVCNNPTMVYKDPYMTIKFVPIYRSLLKDNLLSSSTSDSNLTETVRMEDKEQVQEESEHERSHSEVRKTEKTHSDGRVIKPHYALSYICESTELGSHLDVEKCQELKVPNGPLMGLLKNKTDVSLPDGTKIKWKDVVKKGETEKFLVVDCPTEEYLESFLNAPDFKLFQNKKKAPKGIIHFTPPSIMKDDKYIEWMSQFPEITFHLAVNTDTLETSHVKAYQLQDNFNYICPDLFPQFPVCNIPIVKDENLNLVPSRRYFIYTSSKQGSVEPEKDRDCLDFINSKIILEDEVVMHENIGKVRVIKPVTTLTIQLFPKPMYDYYHVLWKRRNEMLSKLSELENFEKELTDLTEFVKKFKSSKRYKNLPDYPRILFLGTGCSYPCKTRNTSGILIQINEDIYMLLDCGEGTFGQILRFFGPDKAPEVLKKLKMVYISHYHADHHLGLIQLLLMRQKYMSGECGVEDSDPLILLVPPVMNDWLKITRSLYPSTAKSINVIFISTLVGSRKVIEDYLPKLGLVSLKTTPVPHCMYSFGISLLDENGFKITYSGDCLPCDNIINIGENSDLLIHEATYEDGMENQARLRRHTTVSQAVSVGERMNAKYIILTHFSQRYSHFPHLNSTLPPNTGVAFDNMIITPKVMPIMPKLIDVCKLLFSEKVDLMQCRANKRHLNKKLTSVAEGSSGPKQKCDNISAVLKQ